MPSNMNDNKRHPVQGSSLRTSLFFESFALLALTVIAVSVVSFFLSWNELKIRTTSQLQSITASKEELLESTIFRQREQISILGRDTVLEKLPSVTSLIGFRQLLKVDAGGNVTVIAGDTSTLPLTKDLLRTMHGNEGAIFRPIVTEAGWTLYVIAAPQMNGSIRTGTLVATFDAMALASRILHVDSGVKTTEVLLATMVDDHEIVLRADDALGRIVPVLDQNHETFSVVRRALAGTEGIEETIDYSGIPVLAAYRSVPTLGWAILAKVDLYEVRAPTIRLATTLLGAGLMIIVFLSLSTFFVGRRIVGPLEELAEKLDGIETRNWKFARSIFTGNEIEIVDSAADALTKRLRKSHENLEAIVTDRTKALQKQLAADTAILQSMADGLIVTDEKGIITYMNHMTEVLTGRCDGKGKHVTEFLSICDKEGKSLASSGQPVLEVLKTGNPYRPSIDPQFTLKKPNNELTALQIRVTPILREKECIGSIAVMRDITDERKIDHMKSEFIALVSHQLRTPLSSMRWYLEMLIAEDAGALTSEQQEYIAQVATSNTRMVHLVNALLNVSKIELGKFQVSAETIDLQKLIRKTVSSFDFELKQKKIGISLDVPEKMIGIRSDKNLVELILENLLSNAIKYCSPESAVTIVISKNESKGMALLSVTDTGIGIPEEEKDQIGHKLFRTSNAKKSDTDGNGLGLYISYIAAETIGATLTFESSENKGTTFSLMIPLDPRQH